MEQTLEAIAAFLNGRLIGDGSVVIRDVNSVEAAREGDVTFAEDARRLARAVETRASAIVVGSDVTELRGRSGISVHDPKLAFALLLELFHPSAAPRGGIHPSAVIGERADIADSAEIRAHVVVGVRARVGRETLLEPGAYVGDEVVIGERCVIGPNVVIYPRTVIGDRVRIHGGSVIGGDGFGYVWHEGRYVKIPQVGNVVIEDDVEIGCNTCVDRATIGSTIIQRGTKIDNLVQIAHNNRIGRHVVIAGQVGLAGSVTIGDYCRLAGRSGAVDHVSIGQQTEIGAVSVVTKSVGPRERLWGHPARPARLAMRDMASLSRLPSVMRTVAGLLKRVGQLEHRLRPADPAPPPRPQS